MEQLQGALRHFVSLRQHRCAGLHEDLVAGVGGGLFGDVDVGDARNSGAEVFLGHRELLIGEIESALHSTQRRAILSQLVDRVADTGE